MSHTTDLLISSQRVYKAILKKKKKENVLSETEKDLFIELQTELDKDYMQYRDNYVYHKYAFPSCNCGGYKCPWSPRIVLIASDDYTFSLQNATKKGHTFTVKAKCKLVELGGNHYEILSLSNKALGVAKDDKVELELKKGDTIVGTVAVYTNNEQVKMHL